MYDIHLYARKRNFEVFGFPEATEITNKAYGNDRIFFGRCTGADYDTQVARRCGDPVAAFSSKDPYYFYRTILVLDAAGVPSERFKSV